MSKGERILEYFRNPDISNSPDAYLRQTPRSEYLVCVIETLFPDKDMSFLELGSGTGRNLHFLKVAGYHSVYGIEQSQVYIDAMNDNYPELRGHVIFGLVEDVDFRSVDLVFTMAVLEHIPDGPVFDKIAKSAKFLLTIEDEKCKSWRHYPRNYKDVFEYCGMTYLKGWRFPRLSDNFVMRLFRSETEQ